MSTRLSTSRPRAASWGVKLARRGRQSWIGHSIVRSHELDLATHALALTAQQVMCTAPLLLTVSALLQRFHEGSVVGLLSDVLQLDDPARHALASLFTSQPHADVESLVVEFAVAAYFLMGTAATTQTMLQTIWQVEQSTRSRLVRQVVWVLAAVPCLAGSMAAGRRAHQLIGRHPVVDVSVIAGLSAFAFYWWTQHLLLGGRVGWCRLAPGSALSGLGITLASLLSSWYIPGQIVEQVAWYGPIGAAVVLSLWLMAVTVVVVAGALAGAVLDERRHPRQHCTAPGAALERCAAPDEGVTLAAQSVSAT